LYGLANNLHFSQRQMVTRPQLGHENFTALSLGSIILPHQLQVGMRIVLDSLNYCTLLRQRSRERVFIRCPFLETSGFSAAMS
jgi:hypothetical protein